MKNADTESLQSRVFQTFFGHLPIPRSVPLRVDESKRLFIQAGLFYPGLNAVYGS